MHRVCVPGNIEDVARGRRCYHYLIMQLFVYTSKLQQALVKAKLVGTGRKLVRVRFTSVGHNNHSCKLGYLQE